MAREGVELIDLEEAAREAGVSVPTIYRWIQQRRLAAWRPAVGRKTQVDRRELRSILRPKRVAPRPRGKSK